jgi:DNA replication and repair protein RecF
VHITRLELRDFRNYTHLDLEPHPRLTVLVGPNAAGKTNIIEALRLLTTGASFRRPRWQEMVRWGATHGTATAHAEEGERRLDLGVRISEDGDHPFTVNDQERRGPGDIEGRLPSVVFTPDDLELVKGPAERRRVATDDVGAQLSPAYAKLRRDYGRVVRQRNTLLKEGVSGPAADVWDEQVVTLGARLVTHRLGLVSRLMERATSHYRELAAGETLGWAYDDRCGLGGGAGAAPIEAEAVEVALRAEMGHRRQEERRRATTLVGPHRDDITLLIDDHDARAFASQGQQRSVALAWKMAEVDLIEEVSRVRPVFLLDDVMSELDARRREALGAAVQGRTQAFVTTTNLGYFTKELLADAAVRVLER